MRYVLSGLFLLFLFCFPQANANARHGVQDAALWLDFEEEGDSVSDATGTQKDALIHYVFNDAVYKPSTPPERRNGVQGKALLFDGYSTWISYDEPNFSADELTLCAFVAPRAFPQASDPITVILGQYNPAKVSKAGFCLGYGEYGALSFSLGLSAPGGMKVWQTFSLAAPAYPLLKLYQWNFIAASYRKSDGLVSIWLNGENIFCQSLGEGMALRQSKTPLYIGYNPYGGLSLNTYPSGLFCGLMDNVGVFTRCLSGDEIEQLYIAGLTQGTLPVCTRENLWYRRALLSSDVHRPAFHLMGGQMWMNEAIGFFEYDGLYHAFYQCNTTAPFISQPIWGHLVSEDLMAWQDTLPALFPEPNGVDNDWCFSGNAAIRADGMPILFYTGVRLDGEYLNQISSASPVDTKDPFLTAWKKENKRLIDQPDFCSKQDFRDPFIFSQGGETWMLVASAMPEKGTPVILLYQAKDETLLLWNYQGIFFAGNPEAFPECGSVWECPVLFRLTDEKNERSKYMLVISATGNSISAYFWLGSWDSGSNAFIPDSPVPTRLDHGKLNMIGATTGFIRSSDSACILLSTVNDGRNEAERAASGWSGFETLMKKVSLAPNDTLSIRFLDDYETLHEKCMLDVQADSTKQVDLSGITGDKLHIKASFYPANGLFSLRLRESVDRATYIEIGYDAKQQLLYLDTLKGGASGGASFDAVSLAPDENGEIHLDIFLDRCVVELIANHAVCQTGISTPANPLGAQNVSLSLLDGCTLSSIQIYQMAAAEK